MEQPNPSPVIPACGLAGELLRSSTVDQAGAALLAALAPRHAATLAVAVEGESPAPAPAPAAGRRRR